jgi:hypothetical protein
MVLVKVPNVRIRLPNGQHPRNEQNQKDDYLEQGKRAIENETYSAVKI